MLYLHPWLIGQPFRIGSLDAALGRIVRRQGVWAATGAESSENALTTRWAAQWAGAGAMQGAGIGRLVHAIRARRQMEEQQDAQTKEQPQRQAQFQKDDRAFGACLTGRGYTIQ